MQKCKADESGMNGTAYQAASPHEQTAYWGEYDASDKKCGQDGLWGKNRLPCLQTLLLESGIWRIAAVRD